MKTLGIVAFILLISTAVVVVSLPKPNQIGTGIGGIGNGFPDIVNDEKDEKVIDWIFNSTLKK